VKEINILIASDSFKGSLSSIEVANSMERGFLKTGYKVNISKLPIADGGEGTVEAVTLALGGEFMDFEVDDVFRNPTTATLGVLNSGSVIIEAASPLGLDKINSEDLNPMVASSFGLGQMILHALDLGAKRIYIGLGGSAVNDGGLGLITALGAKPLDKNNNPIRDGALGLEDVCEIDIFNLDKRLKSVEIFLLSDVTNPLCGKTGATYIYGPQKGIEVKDLELVDSWMKNYGKLLQELFKYDVSIVPGAGAAGGLGAALIAFANAKMNKGIEKILEMIDIETKMQKSDIVFTGEGKMDIQSKYGKAPIGIAKLAKKYNLPVVAIVGSVENSAIDNVSQEIDLILNIINEPMSLEKAMDNVESLVETTAYMALNCFAKWKSMFECLD
ncbi:MAG: glycerate kinase, partial [Tissierellia bacterium]|nr:glycerate kinase [Tissierellia bacterium]